MPWEEAEEIRNGVMMDLRWLFGRHLIAVEVSPAEYPPVGSHHHRIPDRSWLQWAVQPPEQFPTPNPVVEMHRMEIVMRGVPLYVWHAVEPSKGRILFAVRLQNGDRLEVLK